MSVFTNSASRSIEQARAYTTAILDLLGDRPPIAVLQETPDTARRAVAGLSETQLSIAEGPGKWSVRAVIRHLADSEIVWGYRLRVVLARDRAPIAGYDQDEWSDRLHYEQAPVSEALEELAVLRRSHLRLLAAASDADLLRVGVHTERGDESVAHMIKMYAGHDLLHLRQIERIRRAVDPDVLTTFGTRYAKAWCSRDPDRVAACYAEGGSLRVNDGAPAVGRSAIAEIARGFMTDFPDMTVAMDGAAPEPQGTVFRWTLTGTNTGPGGTGHRVQISGYELWRFDADGLIAESKGHFDAAEYQRQLAHGVEV